MEVKRLAIIFLFCLMTLFAWVKFLTEEPIQPKVPSVSIIQMPELVACGCDDAFRCMSDQDYMQLVAFFSQEQETFSPSFCEGCP